jgi:hypothetical protein
LTAVEGFDEVDGGVVWVVRGLLLHDFLISQFLFEFEFILSKN